MAAGLEALYSRGDAAAAVELFRKVLAVAPEHYGATYQLAAALGRQGAAEEAALWWQRALTLAEAHHDEATANRARIELGEHSGFEGTEDELMRRGMELLYELGGPASAVPWFRAVLDRNPDHYGAHYQLATALDRMGTPDAAVDLWLKVLAMAEANGDSETALTARQRLGAPSQ